jgi:hypothetical protein
VMTTGKGAHWMLECTPFEPERPGIAGSLARAAQRDGLAQPPAPASDLWCAIRCRVLQRSASSFVIIGHGRSGMRSGLRDAAERLDAVPGGACQARSPALAEDRTRIPLNTSNPNFRRTP